MTSLNDLLKTHCRIIVLYPIYVGISNELESRFPLVQDVRENPEKYPAPYVSPRKLTGITGSNNEQIVELFTQLEGKHVEVMAKIYRKEPSAWFMEKRKFKGHLLASLPDCTFPIWDEDIHQLCSNFLTTL